MRPLHRAAPQCPAKKVRAAWGPYPPPFERGSDRPAPLARDDGLEPFQFTDTHGRTAGHLSGSDRATRCPTGKEPCREELAILAKAYGFENYQIVRGHETADNFQMTIRLTGCQLAAGRALAGLSRYELAERAGLSYHSIRAW